MSAKDARISGERWNRLVKAALERYEAKKEMLVQAVLADGYPPFTEPLKPQQQYERLKAMQANGDPAYWNDPAAQATLAKLAQRFGPPAPLTQLPYGQQLPNNPAVQERLSALAQRLGGG